MDWTVFLYTSDYLKHYANTPFLKWIVTGNERWIFYNSRHYKLPQVSFHSNNVVYMVALVESIGVFGGIGRDLLWLLSEKVK